MEPNESPSMFPVFLPMGTMKEDEGRTIEIVGNSEICKLKTFLARGSMRIKYVNRLEF